MQVNAQKAAFVVLKPRIHVIQKCSPGFEIVLGVRILHEFRKKEHEIGTSPNNSKKATTTLMELIDKYFVWMGLVRTAKTRSHARLARLLFRLRFKI